MTEPIAAAERLAALLLRGGGAIPSSWRKALFRGCFALLYHLSARRRLVALHNLRRAFPDLSDGEVIRLAKGSFRNMALVAAECFDIPRLTRENIGALVEAEGLEHSAKALEKGRGVLFFGAHFGNWELEGVAVSLFIKPFVVIYRRLDNPVLDALVRRIRSSTGNTPLPKEHAMRPMLRTLKRNDMLGILIDQNVDHYEGVFIDFFGRPACTTDGLALLALHTGAPVLPAYLARKPDGRYRFVVGPEVEITNTGNWEEDVQVNTQRFMTILEETIRRYPDQWLWVHQRWKTQLCQAHRKGAPAAEGTAAP
jgi:KDO2-lipid IV(A) lauroyltransferase